MPKSKQDIIEYLASISNATEEQARVMLEGLVRMAYREAVNGFTIPGLCKIELVEREARIGRHPQTGEEIEIPARKVLKIRPVQKAKEMITRTPHTPDEAVMAPPVESLPKSPADTHVDEPIYITFSCTNCGNQIEASTDMAGMKAQCPGCGAPISVPSAEAISQLAGLEQIATPPPEAAPAEGGEEEWQKGSTIRIELPKGEEAYTRPVRRTVYIKRRK